MHEVFGVIREPTRSLDQQPVVLDQQSLWQDEQPVVQDQ